MSIRAAAFVPRSFTTAKGAVVTLRAIRADDEAAFNHAFLSLSAETRYSRFMSVLRQLTPEALDRATRPDDRYEFALVAVVPGPAGEQVVAGGRCVAMDDPTSCEFAVTVADAWQGHGLGREMLTALRDTAAARGHRAMEGFVLSTNLAMRRLGARLGFHDGPMPGDATCRHLTVDLGGDGSRAAGP